MKKKLILAGTVLMGAGLALAGCGDSSKTSDGKTKIEMVQYKPEAVKAFEKMEEKFNETHDDIELTIESPNEGMNNPQDKIYQGRSAGYHWNWWRCELFQFPGF